LVSLAAAINEATRKFSGASPAEAFASKVRQFKISFTPGLSPMIVAGKFDPF
jgi:hypothetical protein